MPAVCAASAVRAGFAGEIENSDVKTLKKPSPAQIADGDGAACGPSDEPWILRSNAKSAHLTRHYPFGVQFTYFERYSIPAQDLDEDWRGMHSRGKGTVNTTT